MFWIVVKVEENSHCFIIQFQQVTGRWEHSKSKQNSPLPKCIDVQHIRHPTKQPMVKVAFPHVSNKNMRPEIIHRGKRFQK